ncbi:hypothetical protein HY3_13810 [Hyphomonas pacifica]|uniref:Uncharacterized protein n=1 Tax=Hyphomonas pacifica TaxID=1280941 RepID=A0A062U366_9PROT|nr:hypothetical protein HY2_13555 [Hyphomonas pacifica]RAN33030.1 hypothetical protein HY3_13810 [Hyphomonas pacifica]
MTEGFGLAPRLIFHTVGPVWRGGQDGEADILANCYRNCLTELSQRNMHRIVFPAISTGAYGYPPAQAAHIAVTICARHPAARDAEIVFAVIDRENRSALGAALNAIR